jgi:hypothetical protein
MRMTFARAKLLRLAVNSTPNIPLDHYDPARGHLIDYHVPNEKAFQPLIDVGYFVKAAPMTGGYYITKAGEAALAKWESARCPKCGYESLNGEVCLDCKEFDAERGN